jgi:hypothetical protein
MIGCLASDFRAQIFDLLLPIRSDHPVEHLKSKMHTSACRRSKEARVFWIQILQTLARHFVALRRRPY